VGLAGHEIGTGAYTTVAITAARALGLTVDAVTVHMGDSDLPPIMIAGGSNNAASACHVVAKACAEIRRRQGQAHDAGRGDLGPVIRPARKKTEMDLGTARYVNANLADDLVPVNADVPSVEIILVPEQDERVNALGIKGIGEIGIVGMNAAVTNAVFNATGKRIRSLPISPEKLLLQELSQQFQARLTAWRAVRRCLTTAAAAGTLRQRARQVHASRIARDRGVSMSFRSAVLAVVAGFSLASLCGGCASMNQPLQTVPYVDLPRYMGDWYVIANIPYFAENGCVDSIESYALRPDGKIHNWFQCRKKSFQAPLEQKATAEATVVDKTSNAVWSVRFFKIIPVKYMILDLDPNYQWVLVGHPSRRYGWIMARTKTLDEATYRKILGDAAKQGYDPSRFKLVPQQTQPAAASDRGESPAPAAGRSAV
jgi:apolipoprotein D and lipocalin family protein